VEHEALPIVVVAGKHPVQLASRLAQQGLGLLLGSPVGVKLDEQPLGSAIDLNALRHPGIEARSTRRILGGDGRAIDAKPQAARAASDRERPLDHEDAVVHGLTHASAYPHFVGARLLGITVRPIDLIDDTGLCFVGCRRKGEVGVAASLE
jgi:hypothetical protein